MYDQYGFYSENGFAGRRAGPDPERQTRSEHGFRRVRFFRVFNAQAAGRGTLARRRRPGSFKDIFSQFFGRGEQAGAGTGAAEGPDLEYGLNIDFWQAIRGTQVRLNITRQEVCPTCGRSGSGDSGGEHRLSRNATARAT